jgi:hypothetical protein
MTTTRGQSNQASAPPMSRVEWAIARYNWYRACGLLDDLPQQTTEVANYQRSPDPPPPKPHLKWYPLSKPDDDIAATYQQPVAATQRHCYSQQAANSHRRTFPTRVHTEKVLNDDSSTMSRVDWAIARYNWYRACGLLDDLAPPTAETTRYQRSPEPPPPKPHLKWYPLSKSDDDTATTYQRSVIESPQPPQRRYCQRAEHARALAMLTRYQAAKGAGPGRNFDPAKHPRADAGQPNGGQFIDSNTRVFRTGEGKHFVVSSDDIPGLSHEHVEKFLDLVEQGSALREEMSENDRKIAEGEDAIRRHGWNPFGSKAHLKKLKAQLAELERDGVALQREWAKLEAEYKQSGFHEHEVTGYRSGANAEYQQDSTGGKGFKNAVRAYRKSQEEDLRGGQGVEPTYDEVAIISAPADAVAAYRLGAAVLRGGYHVARQGGAYVLRKSLARQAARIAKGKTDDFVHLFWNKWRIPSKVADLRAAYNEEVEGLAEYAKHLLGQGASEHEVALTMQELRRGLGVKYKDATPPDLREYIYKFNEARYEDKLGPTYKWLSEVKELSDAQIIKGASKSLGTKQELGQALLKHFGEEIMPILKKYDMLN